MTDSQRSSLQRGTPYSSGNSEAVVTCSEEAGERHEIHTAVISAHLPFPVISPFPLSPQEAHGSSPRTRRRDRARRAAAARRKGSGQAGLGFPWSARTKPTAATRKGPHTAAPSLSCSPTWPTSSGWAAPPNLKNRVPAPLRRPSFVFMTRFLLPALALTLPGPQGVLPAGQPAAEPGRLRRERAIISLFAPPFPGVWGARGSRNHFRLLPSLTPYAQRYRTVAKAAPGQPQCPPPTGRDKGTATSLNPLHRPLPTVPREGLGEPELQADKPLRSRPPSSSPPRTLASSPSAPGAYGHIENSSDRLR